MSAAAENKVTDAAVNDVTAALANTTVSGKSDDKADAFLASAAEGRRLYIGNLAYATTEEELKEFFKGYLVESVSIPKNPRTERPVGYAFVDLSTPTEADRAVTELSGKEILERKVSVQLARKPETAAEKEVANGEGADGARRRQSTRGRGRASRGRGGRRGGRTDEEGAPVDGENASVEAAATEKEAKSGSEEAGKKASQPRERDARPRAPRERGPPADGVPSKTKVMVANLPYDLKEDALKDLFSAYSPSSAKIALRPIPRFMIKKLQARNEPRKGRGFGFVTLATEELQQKAVAEMNGKEIDGREIAVKVAIDSPDKTDEEANAPEGAEAAPAAEPEAATA